MLVKFSLPGFGGPEYLQPPLDLNILLLSVSEQYYKYVTSVIEQQNNNDDYYAEPTKVYNNINNGYGIFAGYCTSKCVVELNK